ncbi:unnamed protein product [Scomber scombrus]|uniref:Unnamed protein product n=1 Tax=Scomber scombrus TaxID=13677 RepID=A0AAV1PRX7_SCOSC
MLMMMENSGMDAHQVDIDSEFEPHSRSRSCTWPLPCPEDFPGGEEASRGLALASVKVEQYNVPACRAERKGGAPAEIKHPAGAPAPVVAAPACMSGAALDVAGQLRKAKSSRRNAWGNLSYADLITRAIESTPDKRLTLSQIYDWMVRFVPYFKDKGDSNSSAGWKHRPKTQIRTQLNPAESGCNLKFALAFLTPAVNQAFVAFYYCAIQNVSSRVSADVTVDQCIRWCHDAPPGV